MLQFNRHLIVSPIIAWFIENSLQPWP